LLTSAAVSKDEPGSGTCNALRLVSCAAQRTLPRLARPVPGSSTFTSSPSVCSARYLPGVALAATVRRMLIDHLVYAVPDLATGVADLEQRFGVRAEPGGRHAGRGTHNALLALGPRTYLEILAPDPGQPEPSEPRPFSIGASRRSGLVAWALACDDIDRTVAEARRLGYDPGEVSDGQRVAPSGTVLRWRATPGEPGAALVPFLISWGNTEHPARSAPPGLVLESVQVEHPEPRALAPIFATLGVGIPVKQAPAPALTAYLTGPNGHGVLR